LARQFGDNTGDACDVALKPLDGSTLVAKGLPNAVSVVATAAPGSMVRAPVGMYAEKIAVGPDARGSVDVTDSVENNLQRIAFAKKVQVSDLTVVMLDRPPAPVPDGAGAAGGRPDHDVE